MVVVGEGRGGGEVILFICLFKTQSWRFSCLMVIPCPSKGEMPASLNYLSATSSGLMRMTNLRESVQSFAYDHDLHQYLVHQTRLASLSAARTPMLSLVSGIVGLVGKKRGEGDHGLSFHPTGVHL